MRKAKLGLIGLMGALVLVVAPTGLANDADVIKTGPCSLQSDWKLKLSPENGRVEVEFEVDQNKRGQIWNVVLTHNGNVFFDKNARTGGRSGSFEIRRVVSNTPGAELVEGFAKNPKTGETCEGSVAGL